MSSKLQTPLEYLLSVINDPTHTVDQRIRAARIALPFTHAKARAAATIGRKAGAARVPARSRHADGTPNLALVKKP